MLVARLVGSFIFHNCQLLADGILLTLLLALQWIKCGLLMVIPEQLCQSLSALSFIDPLASAAALRENQNQ
ncbi:von Willebrand factor A domain-containing protein 3A [Trichinella spiralis]|uniref:von Willebrand factor A domain-containing protein 3A n=1 Tax=Trichinella spiralis TaxID=6334 RepID=A0ABR3KNP0_TRISP